MVKPQKTVTDTSGLSALAWTCIEKKQYDAAERYLEQSLKQGATEKAWRGLGVIHRARKDTAKAMGCVNQALKLNPKDAQSLALQGELYFDAGDIRQAVGHYVLAIQADPDNAAFQTRFVELAGSMPFYKHNPEIENALLACLKTPGVDCARAQILWYTTLTQNPDFKKVYKYSNAGSFVAFNKKAFDKADWRSLLNPFFLYGLRKIAIYNLPFEEFLTHLRLRLLDNFTADEQKLAREELADVAAGLAHYCLYTEFLFAASADELKRVAELRQRLETDDAAMKDPFAVALYACYAPLSGLRTAEKIAAIHAAGPIASVIKVQITDQLALERRKAEIVALTEIDDAISRKVQAQYEEFPYPRWVSLYDTPTEEDQALRGKKAQILVAGCGTGREAVQLAVSFPDAEILAVDLSRISLAYAAGRIQDLSVGNVTLRQADILKLGGIGRTFDFIASSGVLHHMADPLKGWKVLSDLLKSGGYMRIGLYSRLARRFIAEARQAIAAAGYPADTDSMKAFRGKSRDILSPQAMQDITNRGDYYNLSMYRDLLFHVQEHCFDIPGIKKALQQLGLEFLSFGFPADLPALYRKKYPDDPTGANLDNWRAFEEENPDTFGHMYHIWCRKKA